jgi:hypothetical protein
MSERRVTCDAHGSTITVFRRMPQVTHANVDPGAWSLVIEKIGASGTSCYQRCDAVKMLMGVPRIQRPIHRQYEKL